MPGKVDSYYQKGPNIFCIKRVLLTYHILEREYPAYIYILKAHNHVLYEANHILFHTQLFMIWCELIGYYDFAFRICLKIPYFTLKWDSGIVN